MQRILVLCLGNICRSPMAEGLLAAALPDLQVRSAGLTALVGSPADPMSVELMQERGIDIRAHRATQINRDMCLQADLVLVMDNEQRNRVATLYPQVQGKTFRLGEYTRQDIPDPYRQPRAAFQEALQLIEQGTAEWLRRIQQL